MTIDEAIEVLQKVVENIPVIPSSRLHIAQRLSIEALKRLQAQRDVKLKTLTCLLPGETEE